MNRWADVRISSSDSTVAGQVGPGQGEEPVAEEALPGAQARDGRHDQAARRLVEGGEVGHAAARRPGGGHAPTVGRNVVPGNKTGLPDLGAGP